MNCECNNKSNRVKPGIKHVYGNVLRMAIPLTLRTLVKDGDEMVVTDTDFIPSSDHPVRVVFSKGKTNYPIIATMDGNVAIVEDKGKIPVGTYDISVECYDDLGNPYRFKQNAVLYVADTTAEAGIDEEIEYEAQTWYLNAAMFLATTQIGDIGDAIDAKLDDVFGNVAYDADAKEIRFYNKDNSRVLATIDSRPFIADGTVADVYIDVSRQVLVVVLNEDAGGRMFSVPLYLVFAEYYKKDEVDSLVSSTEKGLRFDFSQELPLVVHVTKNGSSYSSPVDFGEIKNAIREDGRLVVACVNKDIFYQLLVADLAEIAFSRVVALDGYQELLIVNESNVWSMEDVDLGTGGGGGYEPPAGGIPKSDLAPAVQASLGKADSAIQGVKVNGAELTPDDNKKVSFSAVTGLQFDGSSHVGVVQLPEYVKKSDYDTTIEDIYQSIPSDLADLAEDKNHRVVTDAEKARWNYKQNAIGDLAAIRSGAAAGATAYQKPSSGIPASDIASGVIPDTSGMLTKSDVSVETQGDGTVDLKVKDDTYTINLNHTHEGMAKLEKVTEATLPQTLADDTIYVQVDDMTDPQTIEALYIFGLEFTGGGAAPGVPYLSSPVANISMGDTENGSVTKAIYVKGRYLTQALSATLSGTGYTFGATQPTGVTRNSDTSLTITADAAKNGVDIPVVYTGNAFNAEGTLTITSSSPDSIDIETTLVANSVTIENLAAVKLTGTQWMQTDYYPKANTKFELDCKFVKNTYSSTGTGDNRRVFLGCENNTNPTKTFYFNNGAYYKLSGGKNKVFSIYAWAENPYTEGGAIYGHEYGTEANFCQRGVINYSNGSISFLGSTWTTETKTTTSTHPLCIGYDANSNVIYGNFDLEIYGLKLYDGTTLVYDFKPVTKDGTPGLLDAASGTFISSETNTELVSIPLT